MYQEVGISLGKRRGFTMAELLNQIEEYWSTRVEGYSEVNEKEINGTQKENWLRVLEERFPDKAKADLKILDVGTGPGFFPRILSEAGYYVTAVDYTEDMLEKAKENTKEYQSQIEFYRMDAQNLGFENNQFDVVISRNLTWTLPHAEEAYQEWKRVLKPGGILLNFDANYGNDDCSDTSGLPKNHAHYTVGDELLQECEEIKKQLPISSYARPAWDLNVLGKAGFSKFGIDLEISSRIYIEKDEFYNPTPLFMLCSRKAF